MGQTIVKEFELIRPVLEGKKFLLVRGRTYDCLKLKMFFDAFPHVEFSGFSANPLYDQVYKGVELFNREKCKLIVAVGGGSAIDVAKCIKLFCRMDSGINYLGQETSDSGIPLVAVPTTAGSGSEATRYAVIYYEGEKQSISHDSIIPDYVIFEPSVLKTLPLYQKKCTMLDALCQAIESWWSVGSTDESKRYSQKAIRTIRENWETYIFKDADAVSEKIMEAANYAGRAINITETTAAHAMSYKLTSMYQLPHGHAVAVCMLEVWKYLIGHTNDCIDGRGEKYLRDTLDQISGMIDMSYFYSIMAKLEMNYPKSTDRFREIDILAQAVNPIRLRNYPVAVNTDVLKDMYRRIVK